MKDAALRAVQLSRSLAFGVFSVDGQPLQVNACMDRLGVRGARFLSPDWETLVRQAQAGGYQGLATLAETSGAGTTRLCRAQTLEGDVLVVLEVDLDELVHTNELLAALNREQSVLQRELQRQRREAERTLEDLRRAEAQLVQSEKLAGLARMAAGLAHEMNSPLAAVQMSAVILQQALADIDPDHPLYDEVAESAAVCVEGTRRLADLVASLRRFAPGRHGTVGPVQLDELLETALVAVQPLVQSQGIQVQCPHTGLSVTAQPAALGSAVVAVLENACKAMPDGGVLEVRARRSGDRVELDVLDEGTGVAEDILDKVFDPFFTTRPVGSGAGLGLSVAWGVVVDELGGTLTLERRRPGTCVRMGLPV